MDTLKAIAEQSPRLPAEYAAFGRSVAWQLASMTPERATICMYELQRVMTAERLRDIRDKARASAFLGASVQPATSHAGRVSSCESRCVLADRTDDLSS